MPGPTRRGAAPVAAAVIALLAAGCGSSRTQIPPHLGTTVPGQPLLPSTATTVTAANTSVAVQGSTTSSPFVTAGLKHTLSSGATVVVSYPVNGARPGKDAPPPPAGMVYALVTAKMCASKTVPIQAELVVPDRFSVEVPGQGMVKFDPAVPVVRGPALPRGQVVAPGTCTEGTISYVIGGERHIESIAYDAGDGLFRWVS